MQNGEDVKHLVYKPVSNQVGTAWDNDLAGSGDAAGPSDVRHAGSLQDCIANAANRAGLGFRVVGGDEFEDALKLLHRRSRPKNFHPLARTFLP